MTDSETNLAHQNILIPMLLTTSEQSTQQDTIADLFIFLLRYSFMLNDATNTKNSCDQKTPQFPTPQGNIYMGARYLDPKYSRWISTDPALAEYIPGAGKSDEADKMPGMGGVFNSVNLSLFHYAGNNPVRYVDPDGREEIPHEIQKLIDKGNGGLPYEPDLWNTNDIIRDTTNCYAYCLNLQKNPLNNKNFPVFPDGYCLQPGDLSGDGVEITSFDYINGSAASKIIDNVKKDAETAGFTFKETTKDTPVAKNNWKVALVIGVYDPVNGVYSSDYHWYRQNDDGTWSHKPGKFEVTNLDYSGKIIRDPQTADRDARKKFGIQASNYTQFVNYFEVSRCSNED